MNRKANEKKLPAYKERLGRFQVSVWNRKRIIKDAATNRDVQIDSSKVCLQYSQFNKEKDTWENQNLWFFLEEAANLSDLLMKMKLTQGVVSNPQTKPTMAPAVA
jgi:hypothetical protein